jgi:hypothetical protein
VDHDTPSTDYLTVEEADALLEQAVGASPSWPAKFAQGGSRPAVRISDVVLEYGPLDATHAIDAADHIDSGAVLGIKQQPLQSIRHVHHRLAQLLAGGMSTYQAALLCNYTINRVEVLKGDPAFQNLMAHYQGVVQDQFGDFVTAASDLSLDMMSRLREILEDAPEKLSPTHLMEAIKLLADRSGHAPVNKSVNLNVNTDMAQRLNAARSRRQLIEADEDNPQ